MTRGMTFLPYAGNGPHAKMRPNTESTRTRRTRATASIVHEHATACESGVALPDRSWPHRHSTPGRRRRRSRTAPLPGGTAGRLLAQESPAFRPPAARDVALKLDPDVNAETTAPAQSVPRFRDRCRPPPASIDRAWRHRPQADRAKGTAPAVVHQPRTMLDSITLRAPSRSLPVDCM